MQINLTQTARARLTHIERVIDQHTKGNPFAGYRQLCDARDEAEAIYFRSQNDRTVDRAKVALDTLDGMV